MSSSGKTFECVSSPIDDVVKQVGSEISTTRATVLPLKPPSATIVVICPFYQPIKALLMGRNKRLNIKICKFLVAN